MEIYQRDGVAAREGGADFHAANEDLIPPWLIMAVRVSKEAAKTIEMAALEINQQNDVDVFAAAQPEKLITADEQYRAVIVASSQLLMDYREAETGMGVAAPLSSPYSSASGTTDIADSQRAA